MALSILEHKGDKPDISFLEDNYPIYNELIIMLGENNILFESEWKHYGKNSGWTLLIKQKKRTLFYIYPAAGYLIILFVLGERAVEEVLNSDVKDEIKKLLKEAPVYMEGRSIQIELNNQIDLKNIETILKIKL